MLSFDYFRQEKIRKFLADSARTGRPKAIILDGCVLVHDLLVIGFATRTNSTPEAIRNKNGKLKPLARTALDDSQYLGVRDVILGLADIRNSAAHEPVTDDHVQSRFAEIWNKISPHQPWPDSQVTRSKYCRAFFSLVAFELGRWQVDLEPTGYFSGEQQVDWERI